MKQANELPCKHAIPTPEGWDECDMGYPCTGSFYDVMFSPMEMDCYERD